MLRGGVLAIKNDCRSVMVETAEYESRCRFKLYRDLELIRCVAQTEAFSRNEKRRGSRSWSDKVLRA